MSFKVLETEEAPKVSVCSQMVIPNSEGTPVYLSGQVGLDPKTMKLVEGGIEAETRQTLENVRAVLAQVGLGLDDVGRMDVLLADIKDYGQMNGVYMQYFGRYRPARAAYAVAQLPMSAKVEMIATAWMNRQDVLVVLENKPRLKRFVENYELLKPQDKSRCPLEELYRRLVADDAHYLSLAEEMEGGGVLFGVDSRGNPLVADAGDEATFALGECNYLTAQDRVYNTRSEYPRAPKPTGYEMFPCVKDGACSFAKSPEILAFEEFTGKPFVFTENKGEWRASYLLTNTDAWPPAAVFDTDSCMGSRRSCCVRQNLPASYTEHPSWFGTRRLLRIRSISKR